MKSFALVALCVAALFVAAHALGAYRWDGATGALVSRLHEASGAAQPRAVDFAELASLPAPVQRYFRAALTDGQAFVEAARVEHTGSFNISETEQWKAFSSSQWIVTTRPGFVWNGRIAYAPGVPVRVHDAYLAGEGILHAALLGLVSLVDLRGASDLARGELMRYLAEAPLLPTALLPSEGLRWTAVDNRSADATLCDGGLDVTLRFHFNEQGLVDTVSATARGRSVGGTVVATAWQGRWWSYERRNGMLVPTEGEVAWLLPDGPKAYWRGHLKQIGYDFGPVGARGSRLNTRGVVSAA
ncbi:MAG: hypothetical protein H0W48_06395 [Methylibium sp.]|nr:hypothetical protein [Methylibium sp.]